MITAHEKRMKWKYDAIAVARMDVLHTRPIPLRVYRGILHYQHPSTNESSVLYSPPWGTFHGMNDRIYIASPAKAKAVLNRLDLLPQYMKLTKKPLHAEVFMKWVVSRAPSCKVHFERNLTLRRFSSTGALRDCQYPACNSCWNVAVPGKWRLDCVHQCNFAQVRNASNAFRSWNLETK